MDLKSLYLLNTNVVTCRAVGLCGFRNSLLVILKGCYDAKYGMGDQLPALPYHGYNFAKEICLIFDVKMVFS